ncbi:energy transducer TonB [Klebsiella sp. BIGb0407]|uniref:energy transducer TonB n=1 Tax=Klebsiella sp. BIGb0407 TaxID=2940603 RepID=UPI002167A61D|nr:energy transducer TonB [Klebsiella sp. BIGb0407]MCS3430449.1 protein TonB [Klebsiella sp. BIGb0407]
MQTEDEKRAEGAIWRPVLAMETKAMEYRRWCGAVLCTAALHGAVIGWLIWTPSYAENISLPPPALMVTLAELPQAVNTEQNDISAETTEAQASEEQAEAEPPPPVEEPVEPVVEKEPQPAEIPLPPPVKKTPPPPKKPAPVPKKVEKPAEAPARLQAQAASRAATEAKAQVTLSTQNAAPQATAGVQASPQAVMTWKSRVMAQLERNKRYPSSAQLRGHQGIAFVRFSLDATGNVISAELAKSSGFAELDKEVVALAYRASPLPAPPDKKPITLTAPVAFMKK